MIRSKSVTDLHKGNVDLPGVERCTVAKAAVDRIPTRVRMGANMLNESGVSHVLAQRILR